MPHVVAAAGQPDRAALVALARFEQAEVDRGRMFGKQGEIDAASVEMRAERRRHAIVDGDNT